MNNHTLGSITTPRQRASLLKKLAIFSSLSEEKIVILADSMTEEHFSKNIIIAKEGDIIDNVYIIIQGIASVTQKTSKGIIEITTLTTGATIGLTANGFFSKNSLRTATVTAKTPLDVLTLSIEYINLFLKGCSHLNQPMVEASDLILKSLFIKSTTAFSSLTPKEIEEFSKQIDLIEVPANITLFKEGEFGEECYLVRSGELMVTANNPDGSARTLATLKPPTLFGETSLLTDSPRTASVHTLCVCQLFKIEKSVFNKFIQKNQHISEQMENLLLERSRPQQRSGIKAYFRQTADGEMIVILKDINRGLYYRLSRVGWYIWQSIDGKSTLQEITLGVFENFFIFSFDLVRTLISNLEAAGFITTYAKPSKLIHQKSSFWQRILIKLKTKMEIYYSIRKVDLVITQLYQKIGYLLFTLPIQIFLLLLILIGGAAFFYITPNVVPVLPQISFFMLLIFAIPWILITSSLHELAHALTTKHFGYEVHRFGIGWYWITPIAFADTSDMWLSHKGPRIWVNSAGIYSDILMAGLASIIAIWFAHTPICAFLWFFSVVSYFSVFKNLSPLLEFDGYYILMDTLDKPNLRESAVIWLTEVFPHTIKNPKLIKGHIKEAIYWLSCFIYLALSVSLAIWLKNGVLEPLFPALHAVSWFFPFLVLFLASLGIWSEFKIRRLISKIN